MSLLAVFAFLVSVSYLMDVQRLIHLKPASINLFSSYVSWRAQETSILGLSPEFVGISFVK